MGLCVHFSFEYIMHVCFPILVVTVYVFTLKSVQLSAVFFSCILSDLAVTILLSRFLLTSVP
jgi:hypothetical protein